MRSDRRGLALVLVMTVVLALTIIATPFVLSMILQERSGTMSRYASQADWGADGARNYALFRLMAGLDPIERRVGTGPNATYYYDLPAEYDVRLDDAALASRLKIADPKGAIWGLTVHDEQGKLNVKTAPLRAINRVKGTVDDRIVSHKDFLTLYSGRDSTWIVPQRIRSMGVAQPGMNTGPGLWCDSFHVLAPDSRVRISKPGLPPFYARVSSNQMANGAPGLSTDPGLPQAYMEGVIEVEARHPVNVNTARREVLAAVFDGLSIINQPTSNIDAATANRLANAFFGKRLTRIEDFLGLLGQQGLNQLQYEAVALNAVCPSWAGLDRSGTVPFCFKSYDVYAVEGSATMSNPAGASVASRGFREVVSVSPPNPLTLMVESQLDFDAMVKTLAAATQRRNLLGFPYGNRITTYPNMLPSPFPTAPPSRPPLPAAVALKSQQGPNEAYVTQVPAQDFRGEMDGTYAQDITPGWPAGRPREHFDNDQEGKKLSGPHTMPWEQVFTTVPAKSQGQGPGVSQPDIAGGGIEFWAKFESFGSPTMIFDIQERTWTNRLSLRIENNELIFSASDSTIAAPIAMLLDDGAAEVRQPFQPQPDTSYHFGAYWKGTRYAQLALLVDGHAHPQQKFSHVASDGTKVITKLGSALAATSTSLVLQDASFLPPNTLSPIMIGNEVVLHDPTAGTVVRGARGTTAVNHPTGATAAVFGYSSKIRPGTVSVVNWPIPPIQYSRIPMGGGTLQYNFGANPAAVVVGDKMMPMMPPYIDMTQTDIGVISTPVTEFPDQGYLRVGNEVIFYTGRVQTPLAGAVGSTAKFTGCVRAQQGTTASNHNSGTQVDMWGVATTDTSNYDSPTIVQVGDEWFGPVQKDMVRPGYWISFLNGVNPLPLRRGIAVFASIPGAHSTGDRVIPTFMTREVHPQVLTENLGRGDVVTVTDAANNKEVQQVNHASPVRVIPLGQTPLWPEASWNWPGNAFQIAAFRDNVARNYVSDDLHVRVLKFPSGELLGLNWIQTAGPQFSIGPFAGTIDEIKAFASRKQDLQLAVEIGASDAQLTVNRPEDLGRYPFGGLLKIGDEYLGYGQFAGQQCSQLRRGWLGSSTEVHDAGDRVFSLYWVPVSTLASDLTATDRDIRLLQALPGTVTPNRRLPPYTKGYVLIDQEMILFEWNNGDGLTLGMPPRFDGNGGLYRGMFGTPASQHAASTALVYGMPWRYWDTYKAREFDNTMSYYQWSARMDGANWRSVEWTEEIPAGDKNIAVHALVRVDGKAEFWEAPGQTGNTGAHLFEFAGGGGKKTINRTGFQNDAGQLDVRFYWEYKQGSFDALAPWTTHSWKRAPKIKQIRVDYDRPTQTLHHEDR